MLFAFGLLNASLFAASILPLSTAHVICEGLGFEAGIDHKFSEAPIFYWLYTILIVVGGGLILIPRAPLWRILVLSQVANGVWLPIVLIFMILLINRQDLMGDQVNGRTFNVDRLGHQHRHDRAHAGADLLRSVPSLGGHGRDLGARRRPRTTEWLCAHRCAGWSAVLALRGKGTDRGSASCA